MTIIRHWSMDKIFLAAPHRYAARNEGVWGCLIVGFARAKGARFTHVCILAAANAAILCL